MYTERATALGEKPKNLILTWRDARRVYPELPRREASARPDTSR